MAPGTRLSNFVTQKMLALILRNDLILVTKYKRVWTSNDLARFSRIVCS